MSIFGFNINLFGTPQDTRSPEDKMKDMQKGLKREIRALDRDITKLDRSQKDAMKESKSLAKSGNLDAVKIMVKEIANVRKAKDRMYASKAHMNSVVNSLKMSIANMKIQGVMKQSTEVMAAMRHLVKVPEVQANMMEMSKEMTKMGIIQEMVDDAMDQLNDPDMDSLADETEQQILAEITGEKFGPASATIAPKNEIVTNTGTSVDVNEKESAEDDDVVADALKARLAGLES